tara:strand:- start:721 stop:1134 length:414 start_codon:yes stop_codon:yes gene_type:complete
MRKFLLIPLLLALTSCSGKSNIDNQAHKRCLQAKDYAGCLNSMTDNGEQNTGQKVNDIVKIDLEFGGKLIGEYRCQDKKFKITNSSADKPFTAFEFDKWYGETDFVDQFRQAGSTASDAQNAFLNVQGLRVSSCSTK